MKNRKKQIIPCIFILSVFALLSVLCYFGPKAEYSESERRPLSGFPVLNVKNVASGIFMDQFETYAADTFPFREQFRSLKACTTLAMGQKANNDIYYYDGYLSELEYPMNRDSVCRAAEKFESIYQQYLTDSSTQVYLSVIPDKNAHLAADADQLTMDYDIFEAEVAAQTSFADYIQISDLLSKEDYYYTDSHWRQEQIIDVAERLLATMNPDQVIPASAYYTCSQAGTDFSGVYKGQSTLPVAGEDLYYLTSPGIDQLQVFDHEHNQTIPVYDLAKATGRDPYEMYLSGPLSLITIDNPLSETDRELVIFRDSFGSSIAPLLASGYRRVTLIDIRYLPAAQLGKYIDFSDCDVLFLYSTSVLNHSETLK